MTIVIAGQIKEGLANPPLDAATATFAIYTVPAGYQAKIMAYVITNARNAAATWALLVNPSGTNIILAYASGVAAGVSTTGTPNATLPAGSVLYGVADPGGGYASLVTPSQGVAYIITIEETKLT